MSRTLCLTIGRGVGPEGFAEPIRQSIDRVCPTRVVFVCTPVSRKDGLQPFLDADPGRTKDLEIVIEELPEDTQNDFAALLPRMLELMDREANRPNTELHIDFTGGNKPMSVAMLHAALSRDVPFAHYVEPRFDDSPERQPNGIKTVHDIGLHRPRFEARIDRLHELFENGEFVAAILGTKRMLRIPGLTPDEVLCLETIRDLTKAHAEWDRFEWKKAAAAFALVRIDSAARFRWSAGELAAATTHLTQCIADGGVTLVRAADIHENAMRCLARHRSADAVARLYRLVEYLLQCRVRSQFGDTWPDMDATNPTQGIAMAHLQDAAPSWAATRFGESALSEVSLGLHDTACLLAAVGDPFGEEVARLHGPPDRPGRLGSLLRARNQSFLAHGSSPIQERDAKALGDITNELLNRLIELEGASVPEIRGGPRFMRSPRRGTMEDAA